MGRPVAKICSTQHRVPADLRKLGGDRVGQAFSGIKARLEQTLTTQMSRIKRYFGKKRADCIVIVWRWKVFPECALCVCACAHMLVCAPACVHLLAGAGLTHHLRMTSDCSMDARSHPRPQLLGPLRGKSARAKGNIRESYLGDSNRAYLLHACSLPGGRPNDTCPSIKHSRRRYAALALGA